MPTARAEEIPAFERELRAFLGPRGVDVDAQAAIFQLYRASTDVIAALEGRALRPLGLSHAGFVVLVTLWVMGPHEIRTLARIHHVSRPAIVGCVDTLERAGFVARERSGDDRRLVVVRLTRAGERLVARAQKALHAEERSLASALTRAEQRTLAALLRRVGAAARSAVG